MLRTLPSKTKEKGSKLALNQVVVTGLVLAIGVVCASLAFFVELII